MAQQRTYIAPEEWNDRVFRRIGSEWMLLSAARRDGSMNGMTASWGGFGVLWGVPVCFGFIRPQRYTFALAEEAEHLSFCFFSEEYRDALRYYGSHSGRLEDKAAACGLHAAIDAEGYPDYEEASVIVRADKYYADFLHRECFVTEEPLGNYRQNDFHKMYICRIRDIGVRS